MRKYSIIITGTAVLFSPIQVVLIYFSSNNYVSHIRLHVC